MFGLTILDWSDTVALFGMFMIIMFIISSRYRNWLRDNHEIGLFTRDGKFNTMDLFLIHIWFAVPFLNILLCVILVFVIVLLVILFLCKVIPNLEESEDWIILHLIICYIIVAAPVGLISDKILVLLQDSETFIFRDRTESDKTLGNVSEYEHSDYDEYK